MSDNLPPIVPPAGCPPGSAVAISTPVLLRSDLEGPPVSLPSTIAGIILDPAGADNEIAVVAIEAGAAGNQISVEILDPANSILTTVSVAGQAISITPGSRARMIVTGAGDPVVNGTYRHSGNYPGTGRPMWTKINSGSDVVRISFPFPDNVPQGTWSIDIDGVARYQTALVTYDQLSQPESVAFLAVGGAPNPPPIIDGEISDAGQVIGAISLSQEASALVASGPVALATGAVDKVIALNLADGSDGLPGTKPAGIGQFCRVGPYPILPPRTEAYDWFIAETMDSWRQVFMD
jgi:hypothetical protein